jgi:hypothetical protein
LPCLVHIFVILLLYCLEPCCRGQCVVDDCTINVTDSVEKQQDRYSLIVVVVVVVVVIHSTWTEALWLHWFVWTRLCAQFGGGFFFCQLLS